MKQGSYQFELLEGRHKEAQLLKERAQMRLDGFEELVRRHGFPTNGNVLEIGCGQGIRSCLMSGFEANVSVTAVDRSVELLDSAKAQLQGSRCENLCFLSACVYALPFKEASFDFVYARLVFMHLENPLRALEEIKRVLKPGARALIEDADRDCMFFEPSPSGFAEFWVKVQEGQRRLGGDPNVGRKLAPYFKGLGFRKVQTETQTIHGSGEDIKFLARTLMPSLNLYLQEHDRSAGEKAIEALKTMSDDPRATFYHFWFAVSAAK